MTRPDIEGIKAEVEQAREEVHALCNGKRWTMRVPARPDVDSDLVIARALDHERALLAYIEELEGVVRQAHGHLQDGGDLGHVVAEGLLYQAIPR